MERVLQHALAETDPEAAARREVLFPVSRGSGPEAAAAKRELSRQGMEYMERVLERIRAEEAARAEAAEGKPERS